MKNVSESEIRKFEALASRWWDPNSEFRPLHEINPLRVNYISRKINVAEKHVLDVGCGGGILAESMAQHGANVTAIDLAEASLSVAKLHLMESNLEVDYRFTSAENLAQNESESFDIVTCLEMLEHVPNPELVVNACFKLLKPGGFAFFSTINRNPKSYLFAIIGAEYLLKLLPIGTHDYGKFIKPSELANMLEQANFNIDDIQGVKLNPVDFSFSLSSITKINYFMTATKK